jgi:hypothetical protein
MGKTLELVRLRPTSTDFAPWTGPRGLSKGSSCPTIDIARMLPLLRSSEAVALPSSISRSRAGFRFDLYLTIHLKYCIDNV